MSNVLLTGGSGFIGGAVARHLREHGHDVLALVRDPGGAAGLEGIGCRLLEGDLGPVDALVRAMDGRDAVIHCAGSYRVGILPSEREAMLDANVGTTTRVLDGAMRASVARIVYVSTVNVFGDTGGRIVDEGHRRDLSAGFLSFYDESKYRAHEVAEGRIASGAPIVIAMPGQVFGRGDHSEVGRALSDAARGRLRYRAFDDLGLALGHVDDVANGIVGAMERGRVGESYIVAGPCVRFREAVELAAAAGGKRPPGLVMPTALTRLAARLGSRVAGLAGLPPNLSEVVRASAGVTYWARADKARRELAFEARDLGTGFATVFGSA